MAENRLDLEAIFFAARQKPAEEQAAYLDQVCGNDPLLRERARDFLSAQADIGSFLESDASPLLATIDQPLTERPGTVIGPYKLMEQIGEGGMGLVFVAEQQQPVRRKVALKVIKPGMDTRQVVARFEAERQALALMDHPNIAKVHDGGETDSGRPYFVMELVKGVPITEHCDQNQVPVRERLELFLHVCQAVQHAHQKGVIHRDIKPSNVLVMSDDGRPLVKVIDFGVAKAMGQQLTDKTIYTQFTQMVGTPLYMSPEQAGESGRDVDTRTDIYALGVLLYELLTGTTPFDKERLKEAAYEEIRRIIREEEPARPSTRMSTLGQAATTASANRKSDPKQLSRLFRGELDWIVMKALEKDRKRRYETASAFAADVQRYLHDEPVLACPPSAWYRFRKFARRNRAALFTAAMVAAALLAGLSVATWQAVRASLAEEETNTQLAEKLKENQRANKNLRLALDGLEKIYGDLAEGELANQPHLEELRTDYLRRLRDFFGQFALANRDDPQAQLEAGKAHFRFAAIQRLLGQNAEAEKNVRQAISALQALSDSGSPDAQFHLAMSWHEYGDLLLGIHRGAEAEPYFRKAHTMLTALPSMEDNKLPWALGHVYLRWGDALATLSRFPEAEDALKKARNTFQRKMVRDPFFSRQRAAVALHKLALVKLAVDDLKQAESCLRGARDEMAQVLTAKPHVTQFQGLLSSIEDDLGRLLMLTKRAREAETSFRGAFALRLKLATDHPTVPTYRRMLVDTLRHLDECLQISGRPAEGLAFCENLTKDHPTVPEYQLALAGALTSRAVLLGLQKQWQPAEDLLRRALSVEEKLSAVRSPDVLEWQCVTLQNLCFVLVATGRVPEAEKAARTRLALRKEWFGLFKPEAQTQVDPLLAAFYARHSKKEAWYDVGTPAEKLAQSYGLLGQLLGHARRWQEVSDLLEEELKLIGDEASVLNGAAWFLATCPEAKLRDPARAVRLAEKALAMFRNDPLREKRIIPSASVGDVWNSLGVARYRAGDWPAALDALEQSRKLRQGGDATDWLFLAMAHEKLGHKSEARKWYAQAVQWLAINERALAAVPGQSEEIGRFRREAEEVLGQKKK